MYKNNIIFVCVFLYSVAYSENVKNSYDTNNQYISSWLNYNKNIIVDNPDAYIEAVKILDNDVYEVSSIKKNNAIKHLSSEHFFKISADIAKEYTSGHFISDIDKVPYLVRSVYSNDSQGIFTILWLNNKKLLSISFGNSFGNTEKSVLPIKELPLIINLNKKFDLKYLEVSLIRGGIK